MNRIDIEGVIGWDVTASSVKRQLANFGDDSDVDVTINSPGGYLDDGFGIYTALKNHSGTVNIHITGLAASMGSVIPMAGDRVTMEETGIAMIHPPSSIASGTAVDMRKEADVLDKYESRLIRAYERRDINLTPEELSNAIAETTWYTAEEFLEAGFIDAITDGQSHSVDRTENRAAIEWLRVAQYKNIPKSASQFFKKTGQQKVNIGGSAANTTHKGQNDMSEKLANLEAELKTVTAERDKAIDAADKVTKKAEALQAMVGHENATTENIKRCLTLNLDADQVSVFMDGESKEVGKTVETEQPENAESKLDKILARMGQSEINNVKPAGEVETPAKAETHEDRLARVRSI